MMKGKTYLLVCLAVIGITTVTSLFVNTPKSDEGSPPQTVSVDLGHGVTMEFVRIQPGSFRMGSALEVGKGDEAPVRKVTITRPFYMGKYEVTQEQWAALMGSNPSHFKGERLPVDRVRWNDAQTFQLKLRDKTGRTVSLPTEAQWEYAARAGTDTRWDFGDSESLLGDYAWFAENAEERTHPVGQRKPNAWGLYDMYGNVQEWCMDGYAKYSQGNITDPQGPTSGDSRILRGGAWGDDYPMVRSSYRNAAGADDATPGTGLRLVMDID